MKNLEDSSLRISVENTADALISAGGGPYILTDDKAPVELLGIRVIDGLIQTEADYYKRIMETDGIRGLTERLL